MKRMLTKSLPLLSLTLLTLNAWGAPPRLGSQCGLTDSWGGGGGEETWKPLGARDLAVHELTPHQLAALPNATRFQLVRAAQFQCDTCRVTTAASAMKILSSASSGGEVYLHNFRVRGGIFTAIRYFPGDNPVGPIFIYGSGMQVATNEDDTVVCTNGLAP